MSTSPNMALPIPTTGITDGPQYADDVNNSLTILDQHTHSPGSGVQITPSGLNINTSLNMSNQILLNTGSVNLFAQSVTPSNASLYASGSDLYFVDGVGNNIRITQSGNVAGAAGTITGLPSGTASAAFAAGTFVFQAATATGANIDGASFILRNNTASSFGLTLSPPNAMGANYSLVLPSIPNVSRVMVLDNAGNMSAAVDSNAYDIVGQNMTSTGADAIADLITPTGADDIGTVMSFVGANAVANSRVRTVTDPAGLGDIAISGSSGSFSTTSNSFTNVTSLGITIQSTGNPIFIGLIGPAGSSTAITGLLGTNQWHARFVRNGSVFLGDIELTDNIEYPSGSFFTVDAVAGGTYTYTFQVHGSGGSTTFVSNVRLIAYEL